MIFLRSLRSLRSLRINNILNICVYLRSSVDLSFYLRVFAWGRVTIGGLKLFILVGPCSGRRIVNSLKGLDQPLTLNRLTARI